MQCRVKDPDFPNEEYVIEIDELLFSVQKESPENLEEAPYFCHRLLGEALERGGDDASRYHSTLRKDWSNMRPWYDYGCSLPVVEVRRAFRRAEAPFYPLRRDSSGEGVPSYTIADEPLAPGEEIEAKIQGGVLRGIFSESATPWIGCVTYFFEDSSGKKHRSPPVKLPPSVLVRKVREV